jgi:maleate isomerase
MTLAARDWDLRDAVRLGAAIPAMNVAVEYDWGRIAPAGMSTHVHRIPIASQLGIEVNYNDESGFMKGFAVYRDEQRLEAITRELVALLEPDRIVYPLTSATGWDGVSGAIRLQRQLQEWSGGLPVTLGVHAIEAALHMLQVRRIALFGPYPEFAVARVATYFEQAGFDVLTKQSLATAQPEEIARIPLQRIREAVQAIDRSEVEVIVQAGAAMTSLALIEEIERDTGKPMLAINPTALWAATRDSGCDTRVDGYGQLWREF